MTTEICIIGLNEIGASLNLALSETVTEFTCTGYDPDSKLARTVRKRGDIKRVVFSPKKAAHTADLIFLTIPPDDVQEYLELLVPMMKTGAILIDMSSLKAASHAWVEEFFPEDRYYVGVIPILNPDLLDIPAGQEILPRSDLFQGGIFALSIPMRTPERVIKLTLGIANTLGAQPFFIDPHELDAAIATVEDLPKLCSMALIQVAVNSPSWREIQRMTGRTWTTAASAALEDPPHALAGSLILNKDKVAYRLDALVTELETLRALINDEDREALSAHIEATGAAFNTWIAKRKQGAWGSEEQRPLSIPKVSIMERLLGTGEIHRDDNE
jgi:prephenate dehydrogenase